MSDSSYTMYYFNAKKTVVNDNGITISDDMYNFTPIMTDYSKWSLEKLYYLNNQYVAFATETAKTEDLSSNPLFTFFYQ